MSFRDDINKAYNKKVVGLQDKVVRVTALNMLSDLGLQTPVDTGAARSNWLPSIGVPRRETIEKTDGPPAMNFSGYILGMKIFIANNLPYIRRLNEGHSKQANPGFVDAIVQVNRLKVKALSRRLQSVTGNI